ncbi:hypothetical protein BKA65DRAFT_581714 [Rhexocercosporidium sp. MPI-PUGE-AT-0058]|nr:hypothetical protein BKA65DRAFT_581714 [Rhexocercosporidium sp. MPI-PUGE-AT-0058]
MRRLISDSNSRWLSRIRICRTLLRCSSINSAGPVAPMGSNAILPQLMKINGLQLRQPTATEIQNIRNHPSSRMAATSDDQILAIFTKLQAAQAQVQAMNGYPQAQAQENQLRMWRWLWSRGNRCNRVQL